VSLEGTLRSLARVAFYDLRKLFDEGGRPLEIGQLDDDIAMAMEGIEVVETWTGSGEGRGLCSLL